MRSRIIPSALFSISLFCASASAEGTYFLLGGGLDLSTFNRDVPSSVDLPDQSMRTGFNILAGFQNAAGESNATVFGIGYETRGAVWTGEDVNGDDLDVTIKFNYIHLAFAYKLMAQSAGPAVYAAPLVDLAILTGSEGEARGETIDMDEVNSIDLDLGLSLGIQIPVARNAFFLEAGYAYGMFNTVTGEASDDVSMHNSALKLRAGFLVGI
jgi:outer membrane protein with beta-barrel domain